MLSQLGCVTLSRDIVNSANAGEHLSDEDQEKYDGCPAIAQQMLSRIPRMESIAQMIALQSVSAESVRTATPEDRREIEFGAQLLRAGLALDALISRGMSSSDACRQIRGTAKGVDPLILAALGGRDSKSPPRRFVNAQSTSLPLEWFCSRTFAPAQVSSSQPEDLSCHFSGSNVCETMPASIRAVNLVMNQQSST